MKKNTPAAAWPPPFEKGTQEGFTSVRRVGSAALLLLVLGTVPLAAEEYDSQGKRDPFLNLLAGSDKSVPRTLEVPPLEKRPPGLPGLLISEVTVGGVASNGSRQLVILKGIDQFTYIAQEKSRLYDGYVDQISSQEVTFVREVYDTRGHKKVFRVVKHVYTESK